MALPKSFIKGFLLVLVIALIGLVPKNSKLLFGYANTSTPWICSQSASEKVVLYQPNHPLLPKTTAKGEVILNWLKLKENADKYTIAYGIQPGTYIYGITDTGNVNSFTIRFLTPGTRYYFVVRGVNGCMPGPWSQEWSAVAPGGRDVGGNVVLTRNTDNTGNTGGTLPGNTGAKLSSPRPTVRPSVIPSVRPSTVPRTGGTPTEDTPPLTFWQRVGQLFGGLFR